MRSDFFSSNCELDRCRIGDASLLDFLYCCGGLSSLVPSGVEQVRVRLRYIVNKKDYVPQSHLD